MRAVRLLRSWWQVDRVRISPVEGRLLRLRPPCIIRVRGCYAQVMRRCVGQTCSGPYVSYACEAEGIPAELRVEPIGERCPLAIHWRRSGSDQRIDDADIEVFG